jgi:hypothetical protein
VIRGAVVIATALLLGGIGAAPAVADGHGHRHGHWGWQHRDRGWHGGGEYFRYSEPTVYYAPPPVVYVPTYRSPGINLVFPLWIR